MKILKIILFILLTYIALTLSISRLLISYIDGNTSVIQNYLSKNNIENIDVKSASTNWKGFYPSINIQIKSEDNNYKIQYPENITLHFNMYKSILLLKPVVKSISMRNISYTDNINNAISSLKLQQNSKFIIESIKIENSEFNLDYKNNTFNLQNTNLNITQNSINLEANIDNNKFIALEIKNFKFENSKIKNLEYSIKINGLFSYQFNNVLKKNNIEIKNSDLIIKISGKYSNNLFRDNKFSVLTKSESTIFINENLVKDINLKMIFTGNTSNSYMFEILDYSSKSKNDNYYKFSNISGSYDANNTLNIYADKIKINSKNFRKDYNLKLEENVFFSGSINNANIKYRFGNNIENFLFTGYLYNSNFYFDKNYIKNFTGFIELNNNEIYVDVNSKNIEFSFNSIFRKNLSFNEVIGEFSITNFNNPFINVHNLSLENKSIDFSLHGFVNSEQDNIKMLSSLNHIDMSAVTDYLPISFMSNKSANYFKKAFTSGLTTGGSILIDGSISEYPFYDDLSGISYALFPINNLNIDYKAGWVPFENINGVAYFKKRKANFISKDINILESTLRNSTLQINNVRDTELLINGEISGPLNDLLKFSNKAGLTKIDSNSINKIHGNTITNFNMKLAFNGKENSYRSEIKFNNANYNIDDKNKFKKFNGSIFYKDKNFYTKKNSLIEGEFNGNKIRFQLKTNKKNNFLISGMQNIDISKHIVSNDIRKHFSGTSLWHYNIVLPGFVNEDNEILIKAKSSLEGTKIDYPDPFYKMKDSKSDITLIANLENRNFKNISIRYNDIYSEFRSLDKLNGYIDFSGNKNIIPDNKFNIYGVINSLNFNEWKYLSKVKSDVNFLDYINKINISVNKFFNNKIVLDNLSISGFSVNNAFIFDSIKVDSDKVSIDAEGSVEHNNISNLKINLNSSNLQNLLNYWGFNHGIRGSTINSNFDISWQGGLFSYSLDKLYGKFYTNMSDGRLKNVGNRASRIFGLFNIDLLSKRLSLDFDDVTKNGFYFNSLNGDFRIDSGNIFTTNLIIKGPSAEMLAVGTTDLVNEKYDMQVIASPEFGETLPAIALLGGPITAAATFAADKLAKAFGKDINDLIKIRYKVSGSWDNPIIEIMNKKSNALDNIEELFE